MSQLNVNDVTAGLVTVNDVITATSGMKLPVYSNSSLPNSSQEGTIVWNTSTNSLTVRRGSVWVGLGAAETPTWTNSSRPAGTTVGEYGWNTEEDYLEIYDGTSWRYVRVQANTGNALGTEANPAESATAIYRASASKPNDGLYYINTPNGGVQQIYCIFDKGLGWMVVGKFAADASSSVANNPIATARGTIDNSTGTQISCDFGDFEPSFNRFIGTNDITNWENTRNVDWYYGVPNDRPWKQFWTGGQTSGMPRVRRNGFYCNGAWDGRGRWANENFNFYQMSDNDVTINQDYFTAPSSSLRFDNAEDAKFGVHSHNSTTGQDESPQVQFGRDDTRRSFTDLFPGQEGGNSNRRDYNTAVYVLIS